jgi:hypothetical protein
MDYGALPAHIVPVTASTRNSTGTAIPAQLVITLLLASAHLSSPPNFPCIRGLRGNLTSRSDGLLTSLPACGWLAARHDLHDAPVYAYTWQRRRPTALIHPRDRRCPGTLRRDPSVRVPGRPPRHDPGQVNRMPDHCGPGSQPELIEAPGTS